MTDQKCDNCTFSHPNMGDTIFCRRYPPTITEVRDNRVTSNNPILLKAWWCGEWKPKANGKAIPETGTTI